MRAAIEGALLKACRLDVVAFKPGNVSLWAAGHGMRAADFLLSARVAVPALAAPGRSVGQRIEDAVACTHRAVGCNTNLGIVLLLAPLAAAAEAGRGSLRARLAAVLEDLDVADARACYRAIRQASPAGLGRAARQDVSAEPDVDLRAAMALAAAHDAVAAQYDDGFAWVFDEALPALRAARARWHSLCWALTACYLDRLADHTDSHVARKTGADSAEAVSRAARPVARALKACENPRALAPRLRALDSELKARGVNPGTTADLVVASTAALLLSDRLGAE